MDPLAAQLNQTIESVNPHVLALLSARGKALYWPRGILFQTGEARAKANRFNATIGEATEHGGPMALDAIASLLGDVPVAEALPYAPAQGVPELRSAWREKLLAENPRMRDCAFGVPIVTSAITHGLSIVADLFVDPGDWLVLPDMLWDNYRLIFEVRSGAHVETFETYKDQAFHVDALAATLERSPDKAIVLLNFPNNPTGYMPGREEVAAIGRVLLREAECGKRLLVLVDDAYFGLVYDDAALPESPFGYWANLHPRILTLKLDAATKELFVWGLRCGFLTFGAPQAGASTEAAQPLFAALEQKVMGAIRAGVSSSPRLSQAVILRALRSPDLTKQRAEKREVLRARAARVREVVYQPRFRDSWEVHPFNAGYFMCLRIRGVDAERLRVHLLEREGVGLIALGQDLRVAFSCLEEEQIEPLFECVHRAIQELAAADA
jgi:aspartate/methionine/tyrosine aminotransferase